LRNPLMGYAEQRRHIAYGQRRGQLSHRPSDCLGGLAFGLCGLGARPEGMAGASGGVSVPEGGRLGSRHIGWISFVRAMTDCERRR